ncbi:hypothetical protein MUN88_12490 [Gracilibacillus caseinilyticus]|uniref:Uncharacterized protein n=1 Tax=Gracilibacillus caseinilyticus TaxID=2932256 RepID=A0ABY4ESR2_9BACI|nr:hypothetical protein [Gracilibacillus caseinilyticus]UOQ46908.1 hypothetical protein MUN88_12490 [Gracilibacillus caseinilyticus]
MRKQWQYVLVIGTIAGFVLGVFLWIMERNTGEKVYTLLLNVDFIPFLRNRTSIILEWFFHLMIAWMITWFYLKLSQRKMYLALLVGFVAGLTYLPLTIIAVQSTPAVNDGMAILYWFIGHGTFGISLYYLERFFR